MKLTGPAQKVGGIDYVSVAGATRRFAELVGNDKKLAAAVERTMETLNNRLDPMLFTPDVITFDEPCIFLPN
jgi:hypothetical protein